MDFGEEPDNWSNGNKRKKRYHRHTPRQIQLLESYISSLFISIQFLILCMYFSSFCNSLLIFSHIYRMFKECPHPDEKQRLHLSREVGLDPRQIKFWFQNRRTQMKVTSVLPFRFYPCFLHCELMLGIMKTVILAKNLVGCFIFGVRLW